MSPLIINPALQHLKNLYQGDSTQKQISARWWLSHKSRNTNIIPLCFPIQGTLANIGGGHLYILGGGVGRKLCER